VARVQFGEEDLVEEEADETASAAAAVEDELPEVDVKLVPKWKATRITEMMPDASVAELIGINNSLSLSLSLSLSVRLSSLSFIHRSSLQFKTKTDHKRPQI